MATVTGTPTQTSENQRTDGRILPGEPGYVFNPLSPEYDRDPYPILEDLRAHAPIFEWDMMNALFLTRHRDVLDVLANEIDRILRGEPAS